MCAKAVGGYLMMDVPHDNPILIWADKMPPLVTKGYIQRCKSECGVIDRGFDIMKRKSMWQVKLMRKVDFKTANYFVNAARTLRDFGLNGVTFGFIVPFEDAFSALSMQLFEKYDIRVKVVRFDAAFASPAIAPSLAASRGASAANQAAQTFIPLLKDATPSQLKQRDGMLAAIRAGGTHLSGQGPPGQGKTLICRLVLNDVVELLMLRLPSPDPLAAASLPAAARKPKVLVLTREGVVVGQHKKEFRQSRVADGRTFYVTVRTYAWLCINFQRFVDYFDFIICDEGHILDNISNTTRVAVETVRAPHGAVLRQSALFDIDKNDPLFKTLDAVTTFDTALAEGRIVDVKLCFIRCAEADVDIVEKDDEDDEDGSDDEMEEEGDDDEADVLEEEAEDEAAAAAPGPPPAVEAAAPSTSAPPPPKRQKRAASTKLRRSHHRVVADFMAHSLFEERYAFSKFGDARLGELTLAFFTSIESAVAAYRAFLAKAPSKEAGEAVSRIMFGDQSVKLKDGSTFYSRQASLDELQHDRSIRVVFLVGMFNEGASIKRVSDVFIADIRHSIKNLYQLLGRGLRAMLRKLLMRLWLPPCVLGSNDDVRIKAMLRRLFDQKECPFGGVLRSRFSAAARVARASRSTARIAAGEEGVAAPEPASASDLTAARTLLFAEPPLPDQDDEDDEQAAAASSSASALVPIGVVDYYERSLFPSALDSIRSRKIAAVLKLEKRPIKGKGVKLVDDEDGFERVLYKDGGIFLNNTMASQFIPNASIGTQSPLSEAERALFESDSNKKWVKDMVKGWKEKAPSDRRPVEVRVLDFVTRTGEIPTDKTNKPLMNSLRSFIKKTDSLPATWVGNEKLELHFEAQKSGCTVDSLEKWNKLASLTNWPSGGGDELATFAGQVKYGHVPFPSNPSHPIYAAPFLDAATISGIKKKNEERKEKNRKRRREAAASSAAGAASSSAAGAASG